MRPRRRWPARRARPCREWPPRLRSRRATSHTSFRAAEAAGREDRARHRANGWAVRAWGSQKRLSAIGYRLSALRSRVAFARAPREPGADSRGPFRAHILTPLFGGKRPMTKVGVNGFGRIGRNVLRAALSDDRGVEFVAVNDLTDAATLAYLLKYDSVHGTIENKVEHSANGLVVDGKEIRVFSNPDPAEIPWSDLGVDIVVESSGRFTSKDKASRHLRKSVEHVIISAPSKDADVTICIGVNENVFDPAKHRIVSNASCTTNCLAPVAKVL